MTILVETLLLVLGIAIMLFGADLLVTKAEKFGRARRWSPVLIGVAVVAVGTSLPELVVSVLAAARGQSLLAASNVIGSNITNIGLIVGISAFLGEIKLHKKTVDYDIPLSIIPIGIFVFGYILHSTLTSIVGVILILAYVCYILITAREYERKESQTTPNKKFTEWDMFLMVLGPMLLFGGGELTLRYADVVFTRMGMSSMVIGGVMLALGTSLPELFATVVAVYRKEGQIAIGNVLGSNVFNILVALGASLLFAQIDVTKLFFEIALLGIMSGVFLLLAKTGKKYAISRIEGGTLLMVYVFYIVVMFFVVK
jgi:cation:H+ antiporter